MDDEGWRCFYAERGVPGAACHAAALLDVCPDHKDCWASVPAAEHTRHSLSRPYIGSRYAEGRVLLLGLNLNSGQDEKMDRWDDLAAYIGTEKSGSVRQHQAEGYRRKVGLGGADYRTPFWSFAIGYATAVTNVLGITTVASPYEEIESASRTWELVAFSEVVKCTPGTDRSEPSWKMRELCPRRFARGEVDRLKPRVVVVLGLQAADVLAQACGVTCERRGRFRVSRYGETHFFGVPHPTSWGGSTTALISEFWDLAAAELDGIPRPCGCRPPSRPGSAESFVRSFCEREPQRREEVRPADNTAWTAHVVSVASEILREWGNFVCSKESKDSFGRAEYLTLDVCALPNETPKHPVGDELLSFPCPAVTIEVENQPRKILYDYWKLLCVRAQLRILAFVIPESDNDGDWRARLAKLRSEHHVDGADLLLIGTFGMAHARQVAYRPFVWDGEAFVPAAVG